LLHFVDGVDVLHALDAVLVSLMHRIDTQITGQATCTARVLV
jgi:hypothetical protein